VLVCEELEPPLGSGANHLPSANVLHAVDESANSLVSVFRGSDLLSSLTGHKIGG
jgi:hypothetical protein